ncbi:hypothetical protein AVEN_39956-1 [Araneus ventricosus]|uniref:Uncharacterized protein n=1 Tax=Araneus ventricosus TaxID=182803 RepID=A0A4Y2JQK9_ARAVE|nr:hypothetical protein AVEN_39956-1 [Araneus ventricosus]
MIPFFFFNGDLFLFNANSLKVGHSRQLHAPQIHPLPVTRLTSCYSVQAPPPPGWISAFTDRQRPLQMAWRDGNWTKLIWTFTTRLRHSISINHRVGLHPFKSIDISGSIHGCSKEHYRLLGSSPTPSQPHTGEFSLFGESTIPSPP